MTIFPPPETAENIKNSMHVTPLLNSFITGVSIRLWTHITKYISPLSSCKEIAQRFARIRYVIIPWLSDISGEYSNRKHSRYHLTILFVDIVINKTPIMRISFYFILVFIERHVCQQRKNSSYASDLGYIFIA